MERKNTDLIKEFNRYVREQPDFADNMPNNAIIIMQLEGDEDLISGVLSWLKTMLKKTSP